MAPFLPISENPHGFSVWCVFEIFFLADYFWLSDIGAVYMNVLANIFVILLFKLNLEN